MRITVFDQETMHAIRTLAGGVYPGSEIASPDYLDWQYCKNPDGKPEFHAKYDVSGMTAQYVLLPKRCLVGGKSFNGALSLNTATRPDCRGQGLFPELAKDAISSMESTGPTFVAGFPNNLSREGFTGKLGFKVIGTLPFLLRPIRPLKMASAILSSKKERKGEDLHFAAAPSMHEENAGNRITVIEPEDERFSLLLAKLQSSRRVSFERTVKNLRWRFLDCPSRQYSMLAIGDEKGSGISAYIVLRSVELMGMRCGVIADIGGLQVQPLKELVRYSVRLFRESGKDAVVAACSPSCDEYTALRRTGFFHVPSRLLPQPLHFILHLTPGHTASEALSDFGNWFLTFGDYDVL